MCESVGGDLHNIVTQPQNQDTILVYVHPSPESYTCGMRSQ